MHTFLDDLDITVRLTESNNLNSDESKHIKISKGNTHESVVKYLVFAIKSMKPYIQGGILLNRAIINPSFHLVSYWLIIIGEGLSGLLAFSGGLFMIFGISDEQKFLKGKLLYISGGTIALMLWYFWLAVNGGEWR